MPPPVCRSLYFLLHCSPLVHPSLSLVGCCSAALSPGETHSCHLNSPLVLWPLLLPFLLCSPSSSPRLGIWIFCSNFWDEVHSSRRADWGLECILKVKYRCWVYCDENKVLNIILPVCILSGQCSIVGGIFCQCSLSAFLRRRI
jgi:hypothetical protein